MILLAILLQSAAVPGLPEAVVIPGPAPRLRHTTAPSVAIRTFRDVCLSHLRDRGEVAAAARRARLRLDVGSRSDPGADVYRRGDLILEYNAAGSLPPDQDQPQCRVQVWLDGTVGEGAFERRFVAALKPVSPGRGALAGTWERGDGSGRVETIGLRTRLLSYGQISATLSAGLRPERPH